MNESKISVRYAKALFSYALEKNILEAVKKDIELVYATSTQVKEFNIFLLSPITRSSDKKLFLEKVFASKVTPETVSFLDLIVKNKREAYISNAARMFLTIYKAHTGIKSVELISSQTISPELRSQITILVQEKMNTKVDMTEKVDPSLLGGFILRIDDLQYDASVSSKLKQLRKSLLDVELK